ncbi:MAG: putative repeat protein (TIGR03806 family), partial [Planctomycetota bacterium]
YGIPSDNPFTQEPVGAAPEIWAFGLRNVWRFSFDRESGDLWAGDVGQNKIEEVDLVQSGGNYGWRIFEADTVFDEKVTLSNGSHSVPVATYGRSDGNSITGGYVYRGSRFPALRGGYFYGDYSSGNLWRIDPDGAGGFANELVRRCGRSIASFGEDDDGELYLLSFDGAIYRLISTEEEEDTFDDWAEKLSETGLFEMGKDVKPAAHLIPYEVNAPFWSDGASKSRFITLPDGAVLGYREDGAWEIPVGATLVKSFDTESRNRKKRLETRLIRRTEDGWEAATYLWQGGDNPDAVLIPEGRQFELRSREHGVTSWHAPSASECSSCHVESSGFVLGITTAQLNRELDGENQLLALARRGALALPAGFDPEVAARFSSPYDEDADLDARARTWLDVNCAMCHRPNGPGNASIDLRYHTPLDESGLVGAEPGQGDLGILGAKVVEAGNPGQSLLLHRVETLGSGRMPPIGSNRVDNQAVRFLADWIRSLPANLQLLQR